jgi:hypothetical protein
MIKRIDQTGFTLVELIVVMVISMLLTGILLAFMFNYWRYSYVLDYTEESFAERMNINDFLRDSVGSAVGLINQNSLPDSHTNAPDPNIPSNLYWKPIHAVPGTYSVASNGSAVPLIYYRRYSFNSSNNYIMNGTVPYEDEYVLYIDSAHQRVLLRSIANPNAAGNRLSTSCPPEIASAACPTDKILINNVSSVALRYFSRSGNFVDWTSIWDPINSTYAGPDFPTAEVVEFTFNVHRNAFFSSSKSTINTTIVRVSLRNY